MLRIVRLDLKNSLNPVGRLLNGKNEFALDCIDFLRLFAGLENGDLAVCRSDGYNMDGRGGIICGSRACFQTQGKESP